MERILVVSGDTTLRKVLERALSLGGYELYTAANGEAVNLLKSVRPDLVVFDVAPPGLGELQVRDGHSAVPVLQLTDQGLPSSSTRNGNEPADDYLAKPFTFEELMARVRALLRRYAPGGDGVLIFETLVLDRDARLVRRGGRLVELTRTEFALLELMMRNPQVVMTREVIAQRVWGHHAPDGSNTLDVYIFYLRRKTEAGGEPRLIQTVRGVGYVLRYP